MAIPPSKQLKGVFSVGDSKKVQFSQGNLRYRASTNTWCFAENQYDIVGETNTNVSTSYSDWIDLFGWGTGNNPTGIRVSYSSFTDWGVNPIANGGNKANQWRTLTRDEWRYLIQYRANHNNLCGLATVNGIHGLILLPDSWTTLVDISFQANSADITPINNPVKWTDNQYEPEEWAKMESLGAVFLPAAGRRKLLVVSNVNESGLYWTASLRNEDYAYEVGIYLYSLYVSHDGGAGGNTYGYSVRLVRDY